MKKLFTFIFTIVFLLIFCNKYVYSQDEKKVGASVSLALSLPMGDFHDDAYEQELFELFWVIRGMRDRAVGMRFIGRNEWDARARE